MKENLTTSILNLLSCVSNPKITIDININFNEGDKLNLSSKNPIKNIKIDEIRNRIKSFLS